MTFSLLLNLLTIMQYTHLPNKTPSSSTMGSILASLHSQSTLLKFQQLKKEFNNFSTSEISLSRTYKMPKNPTSIKLISPE